MLIITSIITALAVLILLALSVIVIIQRYRAKTALGEGADAPLLQRAVRAHGNFAEFTPFVLILLALLELAASTAPALWTLGVIYLLGRLSHAYSLLVAERYDWGWAKGFPYFRTIGMMTTFGVLVVGALMLLVNTM